MKTKSIACALGLASQLAVGLPAQKAAPSAPRLFGCYQLRVVSAEKPGATKYLTAVPRWIRLDSALLYGAEARTGTRKVSSAPWTPPLPRSYHAGWTVMPGDSLKLVWGDGIASLAFAFRVLPDTLRGVARYGTEGAEGPVLMTVKAWRGRCKIEK